MKTPAPLPAAAALLLAALFLTTGCQTVTMDERRQLARQRVSPELYARLVHKRKISVADVVQLSRRGLPNSQIIYFLYLTRSQFPLSRAQMTRLEARGVSGDVVAFMVENERPTLLSTFTDL